MTLVTQHFDTLQTEVMRLHLMAQEVNTLLQAQAAILSIRDANLGLPKNVLDQLEELSFTMSQLSTQVEDEQTELAQLRALSSTAAIVNSSLEWSTVIPKAMDLVIGLTDAERGYIMLRDDDSGRWEVSVALNIDKNAMDEEDFEVSRTIVDRVITTAQPVYTSNAAEDDRFNAVDSIHRYEMRSIMCVPLLYQHEVEGVIYVDNPFRDSSFGPKELRLLNAFANQAAIAIKNAELFEKVREQVQEVEEIRQFLDNVFASIGAGVITTDGNGIVQTVNPAAEDILDINAEESLYRSIVDILPSIYEGFSDVLKNVQKTGEVEVVEIDTVLPSRGPTYLSMKISPLRDETNNTLGAAIVIDDLTDIKSRDETLNMINTYLPPAMVKDITNIDSIGLGGEERVISVVFADVRGFTTFSESLPPEELLESINKYLSIGADAINDQEGIIDKYMGDAIVGLFNTQFNAHEDHAERAVLTAMQTIEEVLDYHEKLPEEERLCYGIGVHTDWAMLGNVGSPSRKEFTALGNAVTYAKKLQEVAQKNELIISKEVYELVKHRVEVEAIERPTRTGNSVVNAYLVTALKD